MLSHQELLQSAIDLAQAGRLDEARGVLRQLVTDAPSMQTAWAWLAEIQPDDAHRAEVMRECLAHNPHSTMARGALAQYENRAGDAVPPAPRRAARPTPSKPAPLPEGDELPDVVALLQNPPPPQPAPARPASPLPAAPEAALRAQWLIQDIATEPPGAPARPQPGLPIKRLARAALAILLLAVVAAAVLFVPGALQTRRQADAAERAQLAAQLAELNRQGDELLLRSVQLGSPLSGPYVATPRPDVSLPALRATVTAVQQRISDLANQVEELERALPPTPGP